jgi:cephalosporin hydroxylase
MNSHPENKTLRERLHILKLAISPARIAREIRFRLSGGLRFQQRLQHPELVAAFKGKYSVNDISEHLNTLFFSTMAVRPRLIVELGTRGGESTRVFLAAAALNGAKVLSVDIEDCSQLDLPHRECWSFIKTDDIEFGRNGFVKWCAAAGLKPEIDLLFIDTSHFYEHTKQEIQTWFPFLSASGAAAFHDTNMGTGIYGRLDRSVGRYGWDNQRGVIRAIEEFVGKNYDEKCFFTDVAGGFLILHHPHSSGFTVMKKYNAG